MDYIKVIREWFDEQMGGGLILPDGWYGRPYDAQHSLTAIDATGDRLTMTLDDENVRLQFEGLESVKPSPDELILGPFTNLRVDFKSYDEVPEKWTQEYQGGEVRIVVAPGKKIESIYRSSH